MKLKNLFSVLSEAQFNSLTKEERNHLYAIDKKLFPDGDGGGEDTGLHNQEWLKKKLERMKAEESENEMYAQEMEKTFV